MYNAAPFRNSSPESAFELIRQFPLATIISNTEIAHLPLIADRENGFLLGHLSRANHLAMGPVTCVFQGPQGYISPSWYVDPLNVPTWNYAVVHVQGQARRIYDPERLEEILSSQVSAAESAFDQPWRYELPEDFRADLLRGIFGLEIQIEAIETKFKLGQNRDAQDRIGAIQGLKRSGAIELARWMERF